MMGGTLRNTAEHCGTLRNTAEHCGTLRNTAEYCGTLRNTAEHLLECYSASRMINDGGGITSQIYDPNSVL